MERGVKGKKIFGGPLNEHFPPRPPPAPPHHPPPPVLPKIADARAAGILRHLQNLFPKVKLTGVKTASAYTVDAVLSRDQVQRAAERLTNPVIEDFSIYTVPTPEGYS